MEIVNKLTYLKAKLKGGFLVKLLKLVSTFLDALEPPESVLQQLPPSSLVKLGYFLMQLRAVSEWELED